MLRVDLGWQASKCNVVLLILGARVPISVAAVILPIRAGFLFFTIFFYGKIRVKIVSQLVPNKCGDSKFKYRFYLQSNLLDGQHLPNYHVSLICIIITIHISISQIFDPLYNGIKSRPIGAIQLAVAD